MDDRAQRDDVDLLVGQDGGHVAHQAFAVPRFEPNGDWENVLIRLAPVNGDQAIFFIFVQDRRAIAAVHGDSAAAGDVADDVVARDGIARATHARQ